MIIVGIVPKIVEDVTPVSSGTHISCIASDTKIFAHSKGKYMIEYEARCDNFSKRTILIQRALDKEQTEKMILGLSRHNVTCCIEHPSELFPATITHGECETTYGMDNFGGVRVIKVYVNYPITLFIVVSLFACLAVDFERQTLGQQQQQRLVHQE
jgi:hypothetical protein